MQVLSRMRGFFQEIRGLKKEMKGLSIRVVRRLAR